MRNFICPVWSQFSYDKVMVAFWIWTALRPVKIQPGCEDSCEQSENIERFGVNEVFGQIFQPVENSPGAV